MNRLQKYKKYPIYATPGAFFASLILSSVVYGLSPIQSGALSAKSASQPANLFGAAGIFTTVSNTMLFVVGALSVAMLIVGGFKYTISGGNAASVTKAKNTILYAIIGLIVSLVAYAVINFVLGTLLSKY